MIKELNTLKEVKAAILSTLLNTEKGEWTGSGFSIENNEVLDFYTGKRMRNIHLQSEGYNLTIKLDAKTVVPKSRVQNIVSLLLDCADSQKHSYLFNTLTVNKLFEALRKEKAVNDIVYKNDKYNDFPRVLEGVQYIIDGVRITVEGTGANGNYFLRVKYDARTYRVNRVFVVMKDGCNNYTVIDPLWEKCHHTADPFDTLLKLTGVR